MSTGSWAALTLLLLVMQAGFSAPPLAEDEAPDPDLSTKGMRRAGPVRVQPLIILKDVGYDDNVRFDATKAEGDTTATAGAALGALFLAGDRGGLRLFQEFDYVSFARNDDLNHWNGASRARGVLLLRRAVLSLEDSFTTQRERPTTEIDERVRREDNAITAALRSVGTGRLGFRTYLKEDRVEYFSSDPGLQDLGDRLDRIEGTLAVIGEVRVLPKTTFTLEGDLQRIEFQDSSQGRDSRARSILPGFRFDPSASVQGEFKVGLISFEAPDHPESDFHGAIGEGQLSTRLGHLGRLKAVFGRSLVFSLQADNIYFVSTSWSVAYEQFLTRRLSGELLFGRGLSHYPQDVLIGGPTPFLGIRDDHLTTYQATLRYRLNPQLSLNVTGLRYVRDSTDDTLDRERRFYSIGTSYAF